MRVKVHRDNGYPYDFWNITNIEFSFDDGLTWFSLYEELLKKLVSNDEKWNEIQCSLLPKKEE